ncbi:ankyrin repeat and protein kinase domain-containing protein 1 [Lingula anatina]|uniref:Ankyrin repeat and protein kinase domain-containing protein 1 n=1 Tax=Lingula anatina TaxID=7574 RepID=A0A1S3HJD8_LINAN|nr:ankyrin repeat and protein kinase domain-containing protein 1 [Lingula anatina]|eukprot:XP_013385571.1 ankyrin repeat and protein kinase domain-containing protein 1 [Lingula anatina]
MAEASSQSIQQQQETSKELLADAFVPVQSTDLTYHKLMGTGGFGKVYHAHHKHWGDVAVKKVLEVEVPEKVIIGLKSEAKKLWRVRHPNIVQLFGVVMETKEYALVMEYMCHGSLSDFVHDLEVPFPLQVQMIYQIILAMNYIHTCNPAMLHLDLKAQNVLVDENFNVKLCDFGLAQWRSCSRLGMSKREGEHAGTITHVPPEQWKDMNREPNVKFDVYAFGIVVWEILAKEMPYINNRTTVIKECVSDGQRPDMNKIPDTEDWLRKIITDSWSQDPNKRPTFSDLKERVDPIQQAKKCLIPAAKRQLSQGLASSCQGDMRNSFSSTGDPDMTEVKEIADPNQQSKKGPISSRLPKDPDSSCQGDMPNPSRSIDEQGVTERFHVYLLPATNCATYGECLLQVTLERIILWDVENPRKILEEWPITALRRYGTDTNEFAFEAGRHCKTGEGIFLISTDLSEEIYARVNDAACSIACSASNRIELLIP